MNSLPKYFTVLELMIVMVIISVFISIAVPKILAAKDDLKEKGAIFSLRVLATDEETYKNDNTTYGTIAQLSISGKINLTKPKNGYVYVDLIVAPTEDYYAVKAVPEKLATPNSGQKKDFEGKGSSVGKRVFVMTNEGAVRTDKAVALAFEKSDEAGEIAIQLSAMLTNITAGKEKIGIDNINKFDEAK